MSSLSRDLGIDVTTVRRWLDVLETSGIVISLPSFSTNLGKRIVKRPKIHFLDTGLVCHLLGIEDEEGLGRSPVLGSIFESWVIGEVFKTWWNEGKQPRLFFYRDVNQKEIDLLIDRNGQLFPFEIKLHHSSGQVFKNFSVLEDMESPIGFGGLIHSGVDLFPNKQNYWMIPASLI